jgi:hypothetical protein
MQKLNTDGLAYVTAQMNYLADDMAEKPTYYLYTPPAGVPRQNGRYTTRAMPIHDARPIADRFSLDAQGLSFIRHQTWVGNFYDAQEAQRVYYPEVAELVKRLTGAEKVLVFDHNVRNAPRAQRKQDGAQEPVLACHNDYTLVSGPQRVRDLLPAAEAEDRLTRRFAFINVWRPIRGPVQDTPLAVCDAQSIGQDHFVATDLKYPDRTGEVYSVSYQPGHRWYYFSDMQPDEAMLLKCYDSRTDGTARFTAHSAFENPASPADAVPRESIEARTIAFFGSEA